jgi:predicted TPR repeat methyltransferase
MQPEPGPSKREEVRTSLDEAVRVGIELHKHGRLDEAEGLYRTLLEAYPDHVDLLHFFGVLRHQRGDLDGAMHSIRRALELDPGYADARNNLGNVLRSCKRDPEAEAEYRRVLAERPDHAEAWNNLGNVLRLKQDLGGALDAYRKSVDANPLLADAHQNLAHVYRSQGRIEEAVAHYRKVLALRFDRAHVHLSLGRSLHRLGRAAEAAGVYAQWLEREPDNPIARHMLAACSGERVPERASDQFVQDTFDAFAEDFDEVLTQLAYQAPKLCAEAVASELAGRKAEALLDAGCGTGLCGPLLRPLAERLCGVDLSPAMLSRAEERKVYDALEQAELTGWLRQHPDTFDVIVAADVLVYFGDLAEVLRACASALRPDGRLVFTTERSTTSGFALQPHGRYGHTEDYLRGALTTAGLEPRQFTIVRLRLEGGEPVPGTLAVAAAK